MKHLKIKKSKLIISLFPFYLLIFLIPLLIPYEYLGFMDTEIGFYVMLPTFFAYWLFIVMAVPLVNIFGMPLLTSSNGGGLFSFSIPIITIPGFFIVALIYSALIYFLLLVFDSLKKKITPSA